MSVSDARAMLPHLLDRVIAGEEVTITRHGQPVAVLVRPDALRSRRAADALARAADVRALLEAGRSQHLSDLDALPPLTPARAKELGAEVRAGRRRRG